VDGQELGEVADHDLRAGHTTLLALSGEARIPRLVLQPVGAPRDLVPDLWRWMAGVAGTALLALGLLALLVRPRCAALHSVAPLALAGWPWLPLPAAVAGAGATLVLALAAARGRRLPALLACIALLAAVAWARLERPPDLSPLLLNKLRPADCRGPALHEAYAFARHPLLRRFNGFVRTQTFRSGPATPAPAAGTRRVIALGSSSTFGYGVGAGETWSAQLALALGPGFEVLNAGVPGSTAERLRLYLQGALLRLQPDVVIVSLTFNDRSMGPGGDERAWTAELLGDGISLAEQWLMRWRTARAVDEWNEVAATLKAGGALDSAQLESCRRAPARFGDSLRDLARAAGQAGAAVVLVCEPVQRGEDLPLLDEYREALRGVGRELGLTVVEPQAALDALEGRGFPDAVHPSRMGHRVVAREIAAGLRQAGLAGAPR
jgi:lysophospholipase L1-like esterase